MSGLRHTCPWPGCVRAVGSRFWGCEAHWLMLPAILRVKFVKTQITVGAEAAHSQPIAHQMAVEEIRNWMLKNAGVDGSVSSTTTRELGEDEFCAGLTTDGNLLLFWPKAGEYLLLRGAEAAVLKRILLYA